MISLESLYDNSVTQRNFEKLAQVVADFGADPDTGAPRTIGVRFGTATVTFAGTTEGIESGIAHGLGRLPQCVLVQPISSSSAGIDEKVFNVDGTNFDVMLTRSSSLTGTIDVYWLVIG